MRYVGRKVIFYLIAAWAAITLNFALPRLMPGNPVDIMLARLQQQGGQLQPGAASRSSCCWATATRATSSPSTSGT